MQVTPLTDLNEIKIYLYVQIYHLFFQLSTPPIVNLY